MAMSQQEVEALNAKLKADPRWQKLHADLAAAGMQPRGKDARRNTPEYNQYLDQKEAILREHGAPNTGDIVVAPDGSVTQKGFLDRNPWVRGAMAAGGVAAAPYIAAAAGGGAAGGGTAGAAGAGIPWGNLLKGGGEIANSLLQGRTEGRVGEANYGLDYDRNAMLRAGLERQLALDAMSTDLDQREYVGRNYQRNARNAVQGGFLEGARDASINAPSQIPRANISGGLRPSAIVGAQANGNRIRREAETELMNPTQPPGGRALPSMPKVALPELSRAPEPNGVDTGLNWAAQAGPILEMLFGRRQPRTSSLPAPTNTPVGTAGANSAFSGMRGF